MYASNDCCRVQALPWLCIAFNLCLSVTQAPHRPLGTALTCAAWGPPWPSAITYSVLCVHAFVLIQKGSQEHIGKNWGRRGAWVDA